MDKRYRLAAHRADAQVSVDVPCWCTSSRRTLEAPKQLSLVHSYSGLCRRRLRSRSHSCRELLPDGRRFTPRRQTVVQTNWTKRPEDGGRGSAASTSPVAYRQGSLFLPAGEADMAVSNDAIREIAKALRRHVDAATLERVVNQLLDIPGNRDFRATIEALVRELM